MSYWPKPHKTPSLSEFLICSKHALKSALQGDNAGKTKFVVGNQSADLDSIVSALLYAYLESLRIQEEEATSEGRSELNQIIPLVNVTAEDVQIRPELSELCREVGLNVKQLLTLDDLGLPSSDTNELNTPQTSKQPSLSSGKTEWLLVDHNKLEEPLSAYYAASVIGCIDHHTDEHSIPQSASPRVILECGSCTSLVLLNNKSTWSRYIADSEASEKTENALATLALASILVDTNNLQDEAKTRYKDQAAVDFLESRLRKNGSPNFDRSAYTSRLLAAKADLDSLSVKDVLRKDFKVWTVDADTVQGIKQSNLRLGIASVVKPLSWLAKKTRQKSKAEESNDSLYKELAAYASNQNLDVCAIMTIIPTGEKHLASHDAPRELVIFFSSQTVPSSSILRTFETRAKEASQDLQLEQFSQPELQGTQLQASDSSTESTPTRGHIVAYKQHNAGKSRKQVGPLLRAAIADSNAQSAL